jgi:hypothetical protein
MTKSKSIVFKSKLSPWLIAPNCPLFYKTIDIKANYPYHTNHEYLGFVYVIRNKQTGRFYIGQKKFWVGSKPASKYKKKKPKESDWESYWSSCNELKTDLKTLGAENFERLIIQCYKTKWDMSYNELLLQLNFDVLSPNTNTYNSYIGCRLRKRK